MIHLVNIVVLAVGLVLVSAAAVRFYRYFCAHWLPASPGTLPHLPTAHWLLGDAPALQASTESGRIGSIWSRWLREFGGNKILALRMPGALLIAVNDAPTARAVNADHDLFIVHDLALDGFGAFAKGVIALEGPAWHRHRRGLSRSFSPFGQRGFFRAADTYAQQLVTGLHGIAMAAPAPPKAAQPEACFVSFETGAAFTALYLDTMGEAMLRCNFRSIPGLLEGVAATAATAPHAANVPRAASATHSSSSSSIFNDMNTVMVAMGVMTLLPRAMWHLTLPRGMLSGLHATSASVRALAAGILRARLAGSAAMPPGLPYPDVTLMPADDACPDFVSQMLAALRDDEASEAGGEAVKPEARALGHAEIVENAMTLLVAATETSAHTTSWVLWAALRFREGAPAATSVEALTDAERVDAGAAPAPSAPTFNGASAASSAVPHEPAPALATDAPTTAPAPAWPRLPVWERLFSEVSRVVGPGLDSELRWEHLERLHYAEGVIKETLRLYSTVEVTARKATAATALCGHAVPAGAIVLLNTVPMHTDEASFAHPLRFVPERWMQPDSPSMLAAPHGDAAAGGGEDTPVEVAPGLVAPLGSLRMRQAGAFNAFGNGPKMCIGHKVALVQIKAALVRLVQGFAGLRVTPGAPPVIPFNALTSRPQHGLHIQALVRA